MVGVGYDKEREFFIINTKVRFTNKIFFFRYGSWLFNRDGFSFWLAHAHMTASNMMPNPKYFPDLIQSRAVILILLE